MKGGLVEKNIMLDVERLKPEDTDIRPLTIDEVKDFLERVHPYY